MSKTFLIEIVVEKVKPIILEKYESRELEKHYF